MVYGHLDRRQVALTDLDFRCSQGIVSSSRISAVQYVKGWTAWFLKDGWRVERRVLKIARCKEPRLEASTNTMTPFCLRLENTHRVPTRVTARG